MHFYQFYCIIQLEFNILTQITTSPKKGGISMLNSPTLKNYLVINGKLTRDGARYLKLMNVYNKTQSKTLKY